MFQETAENTRIIYEFRNKKRSFEKEILPEEMAKNLLLELNNIDLLINYLNNMKYLPLINILNHIGIKIYKSHDNVYMIMDFSKSSVKIMREDLNPFDEIRKNVAMTFKNIDKKFIFKINNDGSINRDSVLFNYLFSIFEDFYNISYKDGFKDLKSYFQVIEMAKC